MNALRLFKESLAKKESVSGDISTRFGPDAVTGKDPYQGKTIVTQRGPYLVGVVGFENDREAEERLAELVNEIR